jgi:acetyl esterase
MPLHPLIAATLQTAEVAGSAQPWSIAEVRRAADQSQPEPTPDQPRVSIHDMGIPGPGGDMPSRVYLPTGDGPHPILMFFHGGGFVALGADSLDYLCTRLCAWTNCMVISVGYRLAPEHPFPAAPDDCLAATRWAFSHAGPLGGDPSRIAVAGTSAGACLAAVVSQRARDEGGPALCAQVLFYPVTDYPGSPTTSYMTFAAGHGLTRAQMIWFWEQYLPDKTLADHPHASPLRIDRAAGLPATHVVVAECDPLHDEGVAYVEKLTRAGVDTVLQDVEGVNHGFLRFVGTLPQAEHAIRGACAWLKKRVVPRELHPS